jgi:hypothetical protein
MEFTDADVEANRLADAIKFNTIASDLLNHRGRTDDSAKQQAAILCTRLSSDGRRQLLKQIMRRMAFVIKYNGDTTSAMDTVRRVDSLISCITGRSAQDVLDHLCTSLIGSVQNSHALTITSHTLVTGLVYRCLVEWTPEGMPIEIPDLTFAGHVSRLSLHCHPFAHDEWAPEWDAAVVRGRAMYAAQLTLLFLSTTPLPNVLVSLVIAYI